MDFDSSSKFVASLAKFLQSLCNGYVDFDKGVEVIGHIHINVDSDLGKKVDYVLNERVCKNNNSITFISNSFPAQPAEKEPPVQKTPETDKNESEQSVVMDDLGQAVPSSTNVGTIGSYRNSASRSNSNDDSYSYSPGSKRPRSPPQRKGIGFGGSPYNKHRMSQSPRYQDSGGPSAKISRTAIQSNQDSGNFYQSGAENDVDYSSNYDGSSEADQKPVLDTDLSIVKEEHRPSANQYSAGRGRTQAAPHFSQPLNQNPSDYAGAEQFSQSDMFSSQLTEGGGDISTLTQAQREELEMYYRKGTDQHLIFLRNMREAHAMYPFTGKRDKELFDKALAELINRMPLLSCDYSSVSFLLVKNAMDRRKKRRKLMKGHYKSPGQGARGGHQQQQYYQQMQQYQAHGGSYPGTPIFSGDDSYQHGPGNESFDYTLEDSGDTQNSLAGSGGDKSQPVGFHGAFTNNGGGGQGSSSGNTGGAEGNGQQKFEPPDIKPTLPPMPYMSTGDFELIEIEEDDDI